MQTKMYKTLIQEEKKVPDLIKENKKKFLAL